MSTHVQVSIACDWCHRMILTAPHWATHGRLPIADADEIEATGRGVRWPCAPGVDAHLCRTCVKRGTPPATSAGHLTRIAAEKAAARARKKAK